jgi:hypothetical protein
MDENPYRAPAEDNEHSINRRRWATVFFALLCLGMAAFFAISAVVAPIAIFADGAEATVWWVARAVIWGLANAATWCFTAWATWTSRTKLRTVAIFSDLAALLSCCLLG